MSFKTDLLKILSGGLPSLIEVPVTQVATNDPQPETIAPEPQLQDNEPFNLANVNTNQVLIVTAGVVGAIALFAFVRR